MQLWDSQGQLLTEVVRVVRGKGYGYPGTEAKSFNFCMSGSLLFRCPFWPCTNHG